MAEKQNVGALAVMDADIAARDRESHTGPSANQAYHDAVRARAAVAEMIEADKEYDAAKDALMRAMDRRAAALARVQGTSNA